MSKILLLNASPYGDRSRGHALAMEVCSTLLARDPATSLIERDLGPMSHQPIIRDYADAIIGRQDHGVPAFTLSESLIRELEDSDHLIITTPMHNFTVPAALKLWIDYVLRHGRTFGNRDGVKFGLLQDRPTLVIVTSGGAVAQPGALQPDHLTDYLRDVLATLGISNVRFVYIEGPADEAMTAARRVIQGDPVFR
ncbi:FMN-dependent NADH-azoreductase [Sphingomonas crocodyli]|uniref:FMN dependent NADH:quinone oxidoreductase n=1 Tax=Sphingomonas crocodyli TaxID=1979270 RepID=A0A437M1A7_9SPHN|nr:NAD(P)H-dependent oxidoreductase [Sphingomonas crocodyli]RVT91323.1 hypothetical protein EOD43_15285 [Sphingomonas crocodyli]